MSNNEVIKEMRTLLGLTQRQFGLAMVISNTHIGGMERNAKKVTKSVMEKIEKATGKPFEEISNKIKSGIEKDEFKLYIDLKVPPKHKRGKWKNSLCWKCIHATCPCIYKPVEGWEAIEFKDYGYSGKSTYHVISCPKFEKENKVEAWNRIFDE